MAKIEDAVIIPAEDKLYKAQLKAELLKQRVKRDVSKLLAEEERKAAGESEMQEAKLVYDPLPEYVPELIPGLLPESGVTGIVGETETGKSLVACEIASSLLTGNPLWGHIEPSRTIGKVVYILGEHTCSTLQGLFHRTKLPHAGDFRIIGPEHLHPYKALVAAGIQQMAAVDRLLKWTEGAGLVIFDPIAGFVQGENSEQDNAVMRTLIDTMSLIAQSNKAACLVLSHMGKAKMDEQGLEIRRQSYATRGASAQEDAMVSVFYLRKSSIVKTAKERFDLSIRKFKGNPSHDVFRLERDPETQRNTLLNPKAARKSYPSEAERTALRDKIQRVRENNPGYSWNTASKVVADSEGLPEGTVRRWVSEPNDPLDQ